MGLPIYFLLLLGMVFLLITACVVYYLIYKRKINMALDGTTEQHKPMPAPFNVAVALTIIFLLFAILMSFIIGFGIGYRSLDNDDGQIDIHAFYAEVQEIRAETITVKGIQLNDEEYRDESTFQLYEGLMIEWHEQPISLSDLDEGDLVSIILITDAGGIEDVFKIYLLDDEM
ncbi:MAG: hypothetical protein ACI4ES_08335 [Roseburia sp.]